MAAVEAMAAVLVYYFDSFPFGGRLMSVAIAEAVTTTEELLEMPQNGTERWLIRGQLRERTMTVRNRWHSRIMVCVAHVLENWRERQPEPRGSVLCGEAGCRLRRDPDSTVGIDVVYIP